MIPVRPEARAARRRAIRGAGLFLLGMAAATWATSSLLLWWNSAE